MSENQANTKVDKKEEQTSKKRDIIKNIAIIFLAVMLVLTFFSNTIMNYSLPQVSTEQISGGSIKNQVRGKGIIEVVDPYNVIVEETRTVSSVRVQEGDYVNEGDVIYTLKGEESEELEKARKDLAEEETLYKTKLLSGDISPNAVDVDLETIKRTMAAFQSAIDSAQKEYDNHEAKEKEYSRQLEQLGTQSAAQKWNIELTKAKEKERVANEILSVDPDSSYEKKRQSHIAERDAANSQMATYAAIEQEYQDALTKGEVPTEEQEAGHKAYDEAYKKYEAASKAIAEDNKEKEKAEKDLEDAKKRINECQYQIDLLSASGNPDVNQSKIDELNSAIRNEKAAKEAAEAKLNEQKNKRDKYKEETLAKVTAADEIQKIIDLQEEVAKLEKKALGGEITSPVTGRIISLSKASGEETVPKEPVATIQVDGKGFQTKLSVDAKLAKTVKVGDEVIIDDYWYYGVTANLVSIQPDKADPKNKRELTFELEGEDLAEGGSISLAVGDSNSRYDLTIPKSALGHDNKGDFILILVPKQVPFGTRYIAKRVEVTTVYATDDTRAAIEAEVDAWGTYVITNSTRPINSGEQVRLAEENK